MKIGINGERILQDNPAGPEIYTTNLIKALSKIDKKNKYVIYFYEAPKENFFIELTNKNPNFSFKVIKKFVSWTQLSLLWELLIHPVNVYFTAVHTLPVLLTPFLNSVVMIHGLEFGYAKEFKKSLFLRIFKMGKHEWYVTKFSKAIIVPSEATKHSIVQKKWIGSKNRKLNVIPEGVAESFRKQSNEEVSRVRAKYNLGHSPYLIFVSTIQPRKNIPSTVQAYSLALREIGDFGKAPLLVIGKKGWLYEKSFSAPQKYGVREKVVFLGRLADKDLVSLLSGARAFINFSLEEGFGLPLLEAMACGVECVVSDIGAFKEIGKGVAHYADPRNIYEMRDALVHVLTNPTDLQRTQYGVTRARSFTWEKTAQETLDVFERVFKHI